MNNRVGLIDTVNKKVLSAERNSFKFFKFFKDQGLKFVDHNIKWGKAEMVIRKAQLQEFKNVIGTDLSIKEEGSIYVTLRF